METFTDKARHQLAVEMLYDQNGSVWRVIKRDERIFRSIEMIEETLLNLGLSRNEAKVYLCLARTGKKKASEISRAVSLHRTETYRVLKGLEKKGLVSLVLEKPLKFVAVPFEKAITWLIETEKMKLRTLEQSKDRLIEIWLSIPKPHVDASKKEVFQILEGNDQIESKAKEFLECTKYELCIFISEDIISRLYHSEFLDKLEEISKKGVDVRLIANDSKKMRFFMEEMNFENIKYMLMDVDDLPFFLISDEKELLFMLRKNGSNYLGEMTKNSRATALWTNYYTLTRVLYKLFTELWNSNLERF